LHEQNAVLAPWSNKKS